MESMAARAGALIEWFCARTDHAQPGDTGDHLTIHDRKWAFCARNAREAEHDWQATGGIPLNDIEQFARARGISPRAPSPARTSISTSR